jgi:TPR repeat protein
MSSPVNENHDKRYMYAPPWARETPQQSPEAIVAAVERLRVERQLAAAPAASGDDSPESEELQQYDSNQHELPLDQRDVAEIEAAMADMVRTGKWTPRSLDPVTMPEPPKPRLDGPTWGMLARLGGAVSAAVILALLAADIVRLPSIEITFGPDEGGKAVASAAPALDLRDTGAAGQPVVASPTLPSAVVQPSTPPSGPLTAYAALDTQPTTAALKSPAAAPQPKLPELRALDRDELAGLIKRGQALLAEGDIASARLLLRRAAEAGDADSALMLAGTYDRAELARRKVIGVAHDHAQAKLWYTRAVEHGSAEAVRRLQQLAQRAD